MVWFGLCAGKMVKWCNCKLQTKERGITELAFFARRVGLGLRLGEEKNRIVLFLLLNLSALSLFLVGVFNFNFFFWNSVGEFNLIRY